MSVLTCSYESVTDIRSILHADLDAFFAAVEQRDNPELRGQPVLVGGSSRRGVVAASSYEARAFGIHSAMPMAEAMRRCPHAIVVGHRMDRYVATSRQFFTILERFSPLVEPVSVDEAFLDVTGSERLLGAAPTIARDLKARVRAELDLVVSVGVAPTKFVAKIASDIDKPDGLCVVEPATMLDFLHPLPVARLWGVGKVTQEKLTALGMHTIGAVAAYPGDLLASQLGAAAGAHLSALARGRDPRQVDHGRGAVSVGHEETFEHDLADKDEIRTILIGQADRVAARLRRAELRARIVVLKIKFADFHLITRRRTLADATSDGTVIANAAADLLATLTIDGRHGKLRRVRLCGISAAGLEDRDAPRQLTLDEAGRARGERIGDTLDQIASRFGSSAIARAALPRRGKGES